MKAKLLLLAALVMTAFQLSAQSFSLPKLNYSYDALQPYIDSTTMRIHYTKHHAAYVNNLNTALQKYPEYSKKSIEEIISNTGQLPEDIRTTVRNNGGGHYNHSLFWSIMAPVHATPVKSEVFTAINKQFGSMENFKSEFEKAAMGRFGSGWAWLIINKDGSLQITSTANQDNPLMDVAEVKGTPVLCLDVWEHAYYLKYQNKRADYTKAFWSIVNWEQVNKLYTNAVALTKMKK